MAHLCFCGSRTVCLGRATWCSPSSRHLPRQQARRLASSFFSKLHLARTRSYARCGLYVGLGFVISEIVLIYFSWAWGYSPGNTIQWSFLVGVWERASAAMFHIYSAGLIAVALWARRYWWFCVFVITIHALTDFPAGARIPTPIYAFEATISVCAIFTWLTFLHIVVNLGTGIDRTLTSS